MNPSSIRRSMIGKKREWTFKAPDRTWFTLSVSYDCTIEQIDPNDFETLWEVNLKHENGQTVCSTLVTTQYDQFPDLHQTLMAVASYFNGLVLTAVLSSKVVE
jgi:hypothetical protein